MTIGFPGLLAGQKDMEGYLKRTENVLCEQRRNPQRLPGKGGWRGHYRQRGGSGPVVVGGVTTTQGVRESRTQGEGV